MAPLSPFDNFPDGTRIRVSHHGDICEATITSTPTCGNLLMYGCTAFCTLEHFVSHVCDMDPELSKWACDQYVMSAWDMCQFYKSGHWYPCSEMIPPPPPTPEVLESVHAMNNGMFEDSDSEVKEAAEALHNLRNCPLSPIPHVEDPEPTLHVFLHFSDVSHDYIQVQKQGDMFEVLYVPWLNSEPMATCMLTKDQMLCYLWSYMEMASLYPNNHLEVRMPGFPYTTVSTSTLDEKKYTLYRAIGMSLEWKIVTKR